MKKILISTGGSGGHVIPAVTLFQHYKDKCKVFLVTDKRGTKFIDENIHEYEIIDVPNLFSNFLKFPINFIYFIYCFFKSINYLKKNNINILFSTGGYMSLPLCIASKLLNIDIFLFEPNMFIGRANKLILRFSKKIICYNNEILGLDKKYINKIFISSPLLRKEVYNNSKNLKNKIDKIFKIIILGGSQGAELFDNKIKYVIINLSKIFKIQVCQQVSNKKKISELNKFYTDNNVSFELFVYDKKLYNKINFFDLAITRSGASAISELSYFNVPFIAIPFPYAKDNHQLHNAKYYYKKNACWIVDQNDFEIKNMTYFLEKLITNQNDYLIKKKNLSNISYKNSWDNVNQKLMELINEN